MTSEPLGAPDSDLPSVADLVGSDPDFVSIGHDHCWHSDHALTVDPPIMVDKCCWCGKERRLQTLPADRSSHGPFAR